MNKKIGYVWSKRLIYECDRIPAVKGRASRVDALIRSYGLTKVVLNCDKRFASESELKLFHTGDYLQKLKDNNDRGADDTILDEDLEFGLGYDCEPIERMWNFVRVIAGGTLRAVEAVMGGEVDIAINWTGGWHHAQRDQAEGFCYINDIAIGIQKMRERFQRVLYIDLDVHHGDGVENAFAATKRVFTLSFHRREDGFFPGTGSCEDCGFGSARGYAANFPYRENLSGEKFSKYFKLVSDLILMRYKPDACVVQCGADVITGDHLGNSNLMPEDIESSIREILKWNLPTVFLGGGGYNIPNTARYWTHLTAVICGKKLDNDIPDHKYSMDYSPYFELAIEAKQIKDPNTDIEFEQNLKMIERNLVQYSVSNV